MCVRLCTRARLALCTNENVMAKAIKSYWKKHSLHVSRGVVTLLNRIKEPEVKPTYAIEIRQRQRKKKNTRNFDGSFRQIMLGAVAKFLVRCAQ